MKYILYTKEGHFSFLEMDSSVYDEFVKKHKDATWRFCDVSECTTKKTAMQKAKKHIKERLGEYGQGIAPHKRQQQSCRITGSLKTYYDLLRKEKSKGWQPREHKIRKYIPTITL